MNNGKLILCFVVAAFFFIQTAVLWGQEKKELLSEKHPWSFVTVKPAKNWLMQYPLPKGQICVGEIHTNRQWPKNAPYVWMTAKLKLPEDYTPGNLYLRYRYDDNMAISINGALVYQGAGVTKNGWGTQTYTRRIQNVLVPGDNYIAVFCENTGGDGFASVGLLTDDVPSLDLKAILPPDGKWSYTFDEPGDNWINRYPLPRGKTAFSPLSTENVWPWDKKHVWMTQVVTLPADYVPGEMLVQYKVDDAVNVYVNGVQVLKDASNSHWNTVREAKNTLRPGKNIVAVHAINYGRDGLVDLDIFVRKLSEEDKASPFANLERDPSRAPEPEPEAEQTETQKQIVRALAAFKMGQEKLGISTLEKAAAEDEKDWVANNILGTYYLLKTKKRPDAFKCFQKCVKANSKDPAVLNNYGVAAIENKKYEAALQSWERLAKQKEQPYQFPQNVAMMMELLNRKRIVLKEAEQTRLVDLYIKVCASKNIERDVNLGFLMVPAADDLNADAVFTQEMKRGREMMQGQPYELKWHVFAK